MRKIILGIAAAALLSSPAAAKMVEQRIGYEIDGKKFEGMLVYDDSVKTKRPAVLMMPDWDGVSPKSVGQAKLVAGERYVVFVADMFGVGYKPKDFKEKREASSAVHKDLALTLVRGNKAMEVFMAEGKKRGLIDPAKTAGIGFCAGGGLVLELARDGMDMKAVVVFHVTYPNPVDPAGGNKTKGRVLVVHGAEDPVTPKKAIDALQEELTAAKVPWQTVMFSGAVHSFTDPEAKSGSTIYDEKLAKRSYAMMRDFFSESF